MVFDAVVRSFLNYVLEWNDENMLTENNPLNIFKIARKTTIAFILCTAFLSPLSIYAKESTEPLRFARGFSGNFLSARIASVTKDTVSAAQFYERALNRDPSNPALIQQTFFLHLINGHIDRAVPYAIEILQFDGTNDLARTILGVAALKQGNYGSAIDEFDGASGQAPLELLTNGLLAAWAEAGKDQLDAALKRVDALEGPDWYESFRSLHGGLIADQLNNAAIALDRVGRAYEFDQSALRIVEAFARLQARSGSPEKGLAVINAFKQQLPNHPYMSQVEKDIENQIDKVLVNGVSEGASEVLFGLGAALGRDGGTELPKIYLQLSLYLNPTSELAIMSLADIYRDEELYHEAVEVIDKLQKSSPFYEGAEIESALNLARLKKVDEAIAKLNAVIRIADDPTSANLALGNLLRFEERFEEAGDVYSIIIGNIEEAEPRHWSLYYSRAITFERTDKWDLAEADFRKALTLLPDQPLVLNYLGYSLIDKDKNYEEALTMIEKAVERRPDEGFIIDSLGWAYYKLKRYQDAANELENAIEKMPEDPLVHDHLGDAYWRVGRKLEAQFQWSHARDLKPEKQSDLEKILFKLENGLPDDEDSTVSETDEKLVNATDKEMQTHIVIEGESLWDIAENYLNNGNRFLSILSANRDRLPENGRLEAGLELRIPVID